MLRPSEWRCQSPAAIWLRLSRRLPTKVKRDRVLAKDNHRRVVAVRRRVGARRVPPSQGSVQWPANGMRRNLFSAELAHPGETLRVLASAISRIAPASPAAIEP